MWGDFLDKLDQNIFKIWRSRCCQLHKPVVRLWDSEILKKNILERWVFGFLNTLLNIGSTLHCSIGNDICFMFVSALKLVYFSDLLGFKSMHIFVCK